MSEQSALCQKCNVAANVVIESGEPKELVCPQCGETEAYDSFLKVVSSAMVSQVQKTFEDVFRGNKHITYRPGRIDRPRSKFRLG